VNRMAGRGGFAGVAALVVGAACMAAAPAEAAKIDAEELSGADFYSESFDVDPDPQPVGGFVRCINGTKVVTGGAYMDEEGPPVEPGPAETTFVASSGPTKNGDAWFISGFEQAGAEFLLQGMVRCLPKARLADAKTISKSEVIKGDNATAGIKVRCPQGYRLISGGGYISRPGKAPRAEDSARGFINSSAPASEKAWFVAASDDILGAGVPGRSEVTALARCLPSNQLADYELVEDTFTVNDDDSGISFAGCPSPDALGPVGGFWHDGDGKLNADYAGVTSLFAVGALFNLTEFPTGGNNFSSVDLELTGRAYCLA
jgi:hypothetical protein